MINKYPGCYTKYADWVMETLLMLYDSYYETKNRIRPHSNLFLYATLWKKEISYIAIKIDRAVKSLQPYI